MSFYIERLSLHEILGRSVLIMAYIYTMFQFTCTIITCQVNLEIQLYDDLNLKDIPMNFKNDLTTT